MAPSSRYGSLSLMGIFLLFLSFFNIAVSSPLPGGKQLAERAQENISEERYLAYCEQYFPDTSKYLFYSGRSEAQVRAFIAENPGYVWYDSIFNTNGDLNHPWYQAFDEAVDLDDAEASSQVMAKLASGDVKVFGAIEWKTLGQTSFFATEEIGNLRNGLEDGRVTSINHMVKDTTDPNAVIATDDGDGGLTYKDGHSAGETNASGTYGDCSGSARKRQETCDRPELKPKEAPEPPKDPKSLRIISDRWISEGGPGFDEYTWKFFESDPGVEIDVCAGDGYIRDPVEDPQEPDAFPNGEWPIRFGGYAEDCLYKGHGEIREDGSVGWLECPERDPIKCSESVKNTEGRVLCETGRDAIENVYCDWDM
ncbi:hypothetical protein M011DRAFT_466168 [Sporormia fimetaria CBS 119925]|uniref:Uncharacterized protein n=1 Tax=Sporormia fimetaria CBS 119925 TaxID=1340428 RepID=A0A6A6VH70_9PLEO|nr:hypothetical protein M011DRAFT_466168 [Sporormia fimetaria CBS 119925]